MMVLFFVGSGTDEAICCCEIGCEKFAGGASTLIMMFEAEFLNEWGIWFCFQADPS